MEQIIRIDKIQAKSGNVANLPALDVGEPAVTLDSEQFWIGGSNGNIAVAREKDVQDLFAKWRDADSVAPANTSLWIPPTMPGTERGNGLVPTSYDPDVQLGALFDPLVALDPDYVTKFSLGLDQSNLYNVWAYAFTPKNYEKTVIVSSCTHGNEYTGLYVNHQFADLLVKKWKEHPQLAYFRKNVRLIMVPIVNPWGHANQKRQNKNLVDLNRNTDYLWNEYTSSKGQIGQVYYKGPAPFSERESQYMRDLLETYKDGLVAYIDIHTINTIIAEHIAFTPRYLDQDSSIFSDVIMGLYQEGERIVWGTSGVPSTSNYACKKYGITGGNPEWCNSIHGSNRDSVEMTKAMKFFGNVILKAGQIAGIAKVGVLKDPYFRVLRYKNTGGAPITLDTRVYNNFPHSQFSFIIRKPGIMKTSGKVKISTTVSSTVTLKVFPYQTNNPDFSYSDGKDLDLFEKVLTLPAGTHEVDLQNIIQIYPTNHNSSSTARTEDAKFRIRCKSSVGTVTLEQFEFIVEFHPTDKGFALEIWDGTGREAFTENVDDFVRTFPVEKYGDDQD